MKTLARIGVVALALVAGTVVNYALCAPKTACGQKAAVGDNIVVPLNRIAAAVERIATQMERPKGGCP